MNKIKRQFKSSFRWNIFGSIFYEISKVLNQIFLLQIMPTKIYGLYATIFSGIYFVIYISEFGLSQTLPAFLNFFTENKYNFKQFFFKTYLLPQIFIYILGATIATFYYSNSFLSSQFSPYMITIPLLIIFEGIRIFLRRFLHNVFISKKIIILETILMILFLAFIWIPFFVGNQYISLNTLFVSYLATSIIGVIFFIYYTYNFYKRLPEQKTIIGKKHIFLRIFKARALNYTTNVTKNFFNGNFLTPFFAINFGLKDAGIFNLANHIAESIKAISKSTIIFAGGGLFAHLKESKPQAKRQAFKMLSKNINLIIYPAILFILINSKFIFKLKDTTITTTTITMALLFFVITTIDFIFMAYEQFYIVEESIGKLFLFKLLEMTLFYVVITSKLFSKPMFILTGLFLVKLISFFILSINAYYQWKLKPYFKINKTVLIISAAISILFFLLLKHCP